MLTDNQLKILAVLSEHPDREFYLNEIGAVMGKHPGVFQKGINALEREGWVISRRRGNQRFFQINVRHPLFTEMKALINKSVGGEALLKSVVTALPQVKTAVIYGSYAKARMRADSDIDLLVVTDALTEVEDTMVRELAKVEKSLQRNVNYKLYEENDFTQRRKAKDPFLTEVLSDRYIMLKGEL